jgi:tRNA pseudouridine55 synthase
MATARSDGLLLVDKPAGMSSHDVVAMVRRARGGVKGGHTGTLDPFATGLLLVALGRATRVIRFVPAEPKVYRATIAFGMATDTDDLTGNPVEHGPVPADGVVMEAIATLTGHFQQVPPDFSARHVEGRRAYAIARTGEAPDLAPTAVTVHSWEVHALRGGRLDATISCGSGTYIRALARDLGRLCGTTAHLASLRRTSIGPFDVRDAAPPDEWDDAPVLPAADALVGMTRRVVAGDDATRVQHGRPIAAHEVGSSVALVDEAGDLVAVAERDGEWWQPRVVIGGD